MANLFGRIAAGQQTVGTSAVQCNLATASGCKSLTIRALAANTGKIYIGGDATVSTTTGHQLNASESLSMDTLGTNNVWLIADAAAQVVTYMAIVA